MTQPTNVPLMFQPMFKYVQFEGRSRRSEFWLWVLFRILLGMACSTIMTTVMFSGIDFTHPESPQMAERMMAHYFTVMPFFGLLQLGLLLPSLAVGVRRLHDIGRTGWWLVAPPAVTFAGLIVFFLIFGTQIFALAGHNAHPAEAETMRFVFSMIGTMFLCIFLPMLIIEIVMLVFFVTEGKRGPNRFGPDPKGEALNDTP